MKKSLKKFISGKHNIFLALLLALSITLCGCGTETPTPSNGVSAPVSQTETTDLTNDKSVSDEPNNSDSQIASSKLFESGEKTLTSIPKYDGSYYVAINNNIPYFTEGDLTTSAYEKYSNLDRLGRCGVASACVGIEIMPTEERGSIGQVKPSGWQTAKYDIISGKYLYNRCHLIGYQLTGENANEANLITGTRSMNVDGMLLFENMVADYVKETGNHVLYRVNPIFEGNNLVASGVTMEGYSVEDDGDGICFNVYVFNAQPGIEIDYSNGNSWLSGEAPSNNEQKSNSGGTVFVPSTSANSSTGTTAAAGNYVLNKNTKKIHRPTCSSVKQMKETNKVEYSGNREDLISQGYSVCKNCNP